MTLAVPGTTPLSLSSRAPSIVVVGADALLAALPATPVQLAHACLGVGFSHVVPASWGDELVAGASLRILQQRPRTPAVQCSCPLVAHRLLSVGTDLRPFLVSLVSPPVALARYLRALYGAARLHITYVGRCPGASDESIDARMEPEELFALFRERHIVIEDQPPVFDSVIPPDRRRHFSQAGGVPSVESLWSSGSGRTLVEITGQELPIELAQLLLSDAPLLVNAAPALGCVCSGRTADLDVEEGRALLASLEPPRSATPIIDTRVVVSLELALQSPHATDATPMTRERRPTSPAPDRAAVSFVRQAVVPPPSLPYHSELEPPHEASVESRVPVAPAPSEERSSETAESEAPRAASSMPAEEPPLPSTEPRRPTTEMVAPLPDGAVRHVIVATQPVDATVDLEEPPLNEYPSDASAASDEPSPIPGEVARYTSPRRRTPVHGVARVAQGDVPRTRNAAGRALPRAYASRRKSSIIGVRLTEVPDADSSNPEETRQAAAIAPSTNGVPHEAPAVESVPAPAVEPVAAAVAPVVVAEPATEGMPSVEEAPVAAPARELGATESAPVVAMAAAEMSAVEVAPSTGVSRPFVRTPGITRVPDEPRPHDKERPVQLPLERLSDRRRSAPNSEAAAVAAAAETHRPPPPAAVRNWTTLLLIVAIVALLSSAAGVALGAWYLRQHTNITARP